MIIWMYQRLIIFILFLFNDMNAESVGSKVNVSLLLGNVGANRTELQCLYNYSTKNVVGVDAVSIMAFNINSKTFESIVTFLVNGDASVTPNGQYLIGRVTLNNITNSSTKAVMIFNNLLCIDDALYRCNVRYTIPPMYDGEDTHSNNISLPVQVPPSKPDMICWKKVSVDSTMKTTAFDHSTMPIYDNHTTSSTHTDENLSTNIMYRATTYPTQQTTSTTGILEGYNITVVCKGNVGNPAAEHVFQRYLNGKIVPIPDSVNTTSIPNMPANCSYYRTSNIEFKVTAADNNSVIRCVVNSLMADPDMYIETKPIEVYYNSSNQNRTEGSCHVTMVTHKNEEKPDHADGNLGLVVGIVLAVVAVIVVITVIIACMRRKNKLPWFKNVSDSSDDSKPKPVPEPRTGDYDYIALEDDASKTKSSNNGLEVEDIKKHNEEYLRKQEEEEKKKNNSNTPAQPAVYAQVNEASKLKHKQKTETPEKPDKKEEDPYVETQEGVYDETGNPRHKENKDAEQFDVSTNPSKRNSNGDNKLPIQTSQIESYANQGFEKDENRKVATVSPTVRSSSGSQNDEQKTSNRNSQSKKGYENMMGTDQTGLSEEESSHRTAL